jgi:hypothetical protein
MGLGKVIEKILKFWLKSILGCCQVKAVQIAVTKSAESY